MASGQTTNLGLPQIIGTDVVNSSDINNGFYKIDEHAGVVNAKITKLETESGGSSAELENVNNTISEVRDDITTIESSVNTNTQDIVLLKRHQNESDARIDALEGASSGGNGKVVVRDMNVNLRFEKRGELDTMGIFTDVALYQANVDNYVNGVLTGLQSQGYDSKIILGIIPQVIDLNDGTAFLPTLCMQQSTGTWYLTGYGKYDTTMTMKTNATIKILVYVE